MKSHLNVFAVFALALTVPLSGCITVTCADGSTARDRDGNEVRVNSLNSDYDSAVDQYCPKQYTPLIGEPVVVPPPPGGPAPTNLGPVLGGGALLGAALFGGGNNANSTTGTR